MFLFVETGGTYGYNSIVKGRILFAVREDILLIDVSFTQLGKIHSTSPIYTILFVSLHELVSALWLNPEAVNS
jgi:hypothetical protein